jgi:hypothetical protein
MKAACSSDAESSPASLVLWQSFLCFAAPAFVAISSGFAAKQQPCAAKYNIRKGYKNSMKLSSDAN